MGFGTGDNRQQSFSHTPSPLNVPASPHFIFAHKHRILSLFLLLDFLIYLDRGIIPGAHDEILRFLVSWNAIKPHPEVYFGILQSLFVGGLALSAPLLSYLAAKHHAPLKFLALGLVFWIISILGCGLAGRFGSVFTLFLSRALSGIGEGAFVGLMAPMLLDAVDPDYKGFYLGLFYGLMPAGVAAGFIISSGMVSLGSHWSSTFLALSLIASIPILVVSKSAFSQQTDPPLGQYPTVPIPGGLADAYAPPIPDHAVDETREDLKPGEGCCTSSGSRTEDEVLAMEKITLDNAFVCVSLEPTNLSELPPVIRFRQCVRRLLGSLEFDSLLICGAAQAAVGASLSSFGTAFLMNLEIFKTEFQAATAMGLLGATTIPLGTFAGGMLIQNLVTLQHEADWSSPNARRGRCDLKKHAWPHESMRACRLRLHLIQVHAKFVTNLALIATIGACSTPLLIYYNFNSIYPLITLGIALVFLGSTQSGLNVAVMASAPDAYRALALSIYTLGIHLMGDVPGPIIVGYMKDVLAPDCRPSGDDESCRGERIPLLVVLMLVLGCLNFAWVGATMAASQAKISIGRSLRI